MLSVGDYSIKRKLTWMNMLVSGAALLLACGGFVVYELTTFRATMVRNLSIQAKIIGANSASALLFDDPESADNTLAALKAAPAILSAGIYTLAGQPFAVYWRDGGGRVLPLPPLPAGQTEAHWITDREIILVSSIVFQGKPTGTVCIRSDLQEMNDRLKRYAVIVAAVLLASLMGALVVSSMFQRAATQPILSLAETARLVSREKQYSVRAPATGNHDEIAVLIEAFNEMLAQIQERDAALRAAQERLNLALKSSGVGTWSWDIVNNSVIWDDYIHPLFGLKAGAFRGTYEALIGLLHPKDREHAMQQVSDSVEKDVPYDTEYRVVWPEDGSIHVLGARGKVYRDDAGRPVRLTGVCWDMTERKRAEEEVQRLNEELEQRVAQRTAELEATNKELEAFTYSVAHDLRAPLRHIQGFSDALVEDFGPQMDPGAREYLLQIVQSTQNMGRLINDLLGLAHVGRQELRLQVTGLNSLVQEVLRDLKQETNGRDIRWQVGDLPFVDCDPGLMKQVFHNLLSNAAKYTRPRHPALIDTGQMAAGGQPVIFVRDNGVGFNMKYANKLFGVFQRLHRQEDFEGTGVGLATVQRIIHKHGGRIWAEAEIDKGATFYFSLAAAGRSEPQGQPVLAKDGNNEG